MKKAFTIVELLVVIGIMGILMGGIMSAYKQHKEKQEQDNEQVSICNHDSNYNTTQKQKLPVGVKKVVIEGHDYYIVNGSTMTHSENCSCKRNINEK